MIRKKSKVPVSGWEEYRKLIRTITADEEQFIQLVRSIGRTTVTRDNQEAGQLVQKAVQLIRSSQFNAARETLAQAERLNPQQIELWGAYGYFYGSQNQMDKAIEALQKEVEYHPQNPAFYQMLASAQKQVGRTEDAIHTLRLWVQVAPENVDATLTLVSGLIATKRYEDATAPLETALKNNPGNVRVETRLLEALLRGGRKFEALGLLATVREQKMDAEAQNRLAYVLADTGTELGLAQDLAQKAVAAWEEQSRQVTLSTVTNDDLRRLDQLGATWDTLGWAYFRAGELRKAEIFINAAWVLLQGAAVADHLGQVYEREGKKAEAIHAYRLALAAQRDLPETRERLEKLGGTGDALVAGQGSAPATLQDELSQMRSVPVPGISEESGSADFFLLFSTKGVEEVRFASGSEKLGRAVNILPKLIYNVVFPDDGPERIARRGVLSCSQYTTPNCNFVLFLPTNTRN